jgi:hypothetical protein
MINIINTIKGTRVMTNKRLLFNELFGLVGFGVVRREATAAVSLPETELSFSFVRALSV